MTDFTRVLAKYYHREGNKIIFRNGMTLNQLAMEMWERSQYQEVDASVLSRVISGQRLFTEKQIKLFCALLQLNKTHREELDYALKQDYLRRHGLTLSSSRRRYGRELIDIFSSQVKKLDFIRERGWLEPAMDWADELSDQLDIFYTHERNTVYQYKIMQLLGETLFQKAYAAGGMLYPKANMGLTKVITQKLSIIAKKTKRAECQSMADMLTAFGYYLLGQYGKSHDSSIFFQQSIVVSKRALSMSPISDQMKLFFLRYISLNSGYLNFRLEFERAVREIRKIVVKHHHSYIFWVLDTIARGQARFHSSSALNTVAESRDFNKSMQSADPLKNAGTIKTEVEVLQLLQSRDISYMRKKVKEGLKITKDYKFKRYKKYFSDVYDNL